MKKLIKFTCVLGLFIFSFAFGQKNFKLIDQLIEKNNSTLSLFIKNHSEQEFKDFSDKFSTAKDEEKIILLKNYLGENYSLYEKQAVELSQLDGKIDRKAYSEGEIKDYVVNSNYDYSNMNFADLTGKRDVGGYNLCCAVVVGTAISVGAGCSAMTALIGTVICTAGALIAETAGIGLCAHNYLH